MAEAVTARVLDLHVGAEVSKPHGGHRTTHELSEVENALECAVMMGHYGLPIVLDPET